MQPVMDMAEKSCTASMASSKMHPSTVITLELVPPILNSVDGCNTQPSKMMREPVTVGLARKWQLVKTATSSSVIVIVPPFGELVASENQTFSNVTRLNVPVALENSSVPFPRIVRFFQMLVSRLPPPSTAVTVTDWIIVLL